MHDARSDEVEEASKDEVLVKRISMWRAIILSSLGQTLFPYSRFIRTLRTQDLEEVLDLLADPKRKKLSTMFFNGGLEAFEVKKQVKIQKVNLVVDAVQTLNSLTEVITKETPMLEELSGNLFHSTLAACLPRLPRLQTLTVYGGEALENTGATFRSYNPSFKLLKFFGWQDPNADQEFARFVDDIRPNSLESFEVISTSQIGPQSFLALNGHQKTLTELKLADLKPEAIQNLSMLKGCTNLTSLSLGEIGTTKQDLEKRHNDVYLETIAWLCSCKNLRTIAMINILSATGLLTPVLLENDIKLTKLEVEGYSMSEAEEFHRALVSQTSLRTLWLKGESSALATDVDILVESISKLRNLTDIRLREISDYFFDTHIRQLGRCLSKLKTWWTGGFGITDSIWKELVSMHHLQDLSLSALTRFTADGIMDFVLNLDSGNEGLILNIMMQDVDFQLSEEEQTMIKDTIKANIRGDFSFMCSRGKFQEVIVDYRLRISADLEESSSEEDSD